ncbi:hypothetical protein [Burkholderia anthina]|uniref:hypothetical protein n=1 Tax=Burkholderia anthina TaxID=179879 RepID=UPI003C7DDAA8
MLQASVGQMGHAVQHGQDRKAYRGADVIASPRIKRLLVIPIASILLGLTACTKSNTSESTMLRPIMHDTRPWCIGRFALDLPSNIDVYNQQFKYMGYTIETTPNMSKSMFVQHVDAREKKLRTELRTDMSSIAGTTSNVWLKQAVRPSDNTRLFVFRDA